jgi:AAA+ superfamily predicted ATPase
MNKNLLSQGCGKTILTQAAAHEAKAKLFAVRPSDVLSKYQGYRIFTHNSRVRPQYITNCS